jgi:hypothetical protein
VWQRKGALTGEGFWNIIPKFAHLMAQRILKEGTKNEEISHLPGSGFGYADALCLRRGRA